MINRNSPHSHSSCGGLHSDLPKTTTINLAAAALVELEHILLRPDTYIGSVEQLTQPMFILNSETDRIVQKEISFTPGLYKIFDEILVSLPTEASGIESLITSTLGDRHADVIVDEC